MLTKEIIKISVKDCARIYSGCSVVRVQIFLVHIMNMGPVLVGYITVFPRPFFKRKS